MKKVVVISLVALIFYAVYSAGMAGYAYVTISNLVDETVPRHIPATASPDDRFATQERDDRIRSAVAQAVTAAGLSIDTGAVDVAEQAGRLAVRVSYQYPVVTFQGETKAAIPVSVTSNFPMGAPR
jgi:hypothetical protein